MGKEAARRVACDAGHVVLSRAADGGVLDVGRRTRTVPTAMRRALEVRDRSHCQFPGCDSRHCDAHHAVHWADGGETKLSNLILLCRFHHRAVHEEGFQVVADAAGGFQFLRPDGGTVAARAGASALGRSRGAAGADGGTTGGVGDHHRCAYAYPGVEWGITERAGRARRAVGAKRSETPGYRGARWRVRGRPSGCLSAWDPLRANRAAITVFAREHRSITTGQPPAVILGM